MVVGIIVFSRMSSSRLPGKALMNLGGIPLIERVLKRASLCNLPVGFATSVHHSDDVLAEFVGGLGYNVFRGDLNNVICRASMAAKAFGYDYFFRICGDRPVFEMEEIRSWAYQIKNGDFLNVDLITNYNPGLIKGITTELISVRALSQIATLDLLSDAQREHVTSYFYDYPSKFNIFYRPSKFINLKNGSLAVDTIDDFTSLSSFFDLKSDLDVSTEEVVEFLGLENCYE